MYIPTAFKEEDQNVIYDFIQQNSFAALVSPNDKQLCATHLPFHLDRSGGKLIAHMARANPHWKTFNGETESLIIFQGPHAYITPSWYDPAPINVPTWNMSIVHAYGVPNIIEDHDQVYAMLNQLVTENEAGFETSWVMQNSEAYVHRRIGAIVAFEITITRLEAKFKLSQNRSEADQEHVIDALSKSQSDMDRQVAELMDKRRK